MSAALATLPPPSLRSLVRSEEHLQAVLHAAGNKAKSGDPAIRQAAQRFNRMCSSEPSTSPALAALILQVIPVRRCQSCGQSFLAETTRRRYCSYECHMHFAHHVAPQGGHHADHRTG